MRYGSYRFTSVLEGDALLPEYKGSTFRGAFGHALKRVVCALRREDCADCLLRGKCIYAFVFETPLSEQESHAVPRTRIAAPPHPYVIEPPETAQTRYRNGDAFDFTLILFGRANDYLPYFIYAFDQMGRLGLGRAVDGKRAAFALRDVTAEGKIVYAAGDGKILPGNFCRELSTVPGENADGCSSLELTLHTPLRLKYENRLEAKLPFHVLVRAMLRRVSSLCRYYGDGEPQLDYRGLVARAQGVATESSTICWFDWKRYSNRQDQSMLMGGMVGRAVYAGDLAEFLPLIRFCERVHLGKQTAFGLGRISFTTREDPGSAGPARGSNAGESRPPGAGSGKAEGER